MEPRFEIRKSPVDGLLRVWEQRLNSDLWDLADEEFDGPVWVVTGVYRTRREIFRDRRFG